MVAQVVANWTAVTLYALSGALFIVGAVFSHERWFPWATRLAAAGLLPHSLGLGLRWYQAGHGPYLNLYEVASSNTWIAVALFLIAALRHPRLRVAGAVVMPVSFLLFGAGMLSSKEIKELVPALDSYWLVLHVLFAKVTYGAYLVATAVAALFLVKRRQGAENSALMERIPSRPILEDLIYKFVVVGFVMHSLMIVTGSIWSHKAFGHYWSWDPIETWSLISWLCYGVFLHLRLLHGWRGAKVAWLSIGCMATVVVAFFGIPFFYPGSHNLFLG